MQENSVDLRGIIVTEIPTEIIGILFIICILVIFIIVFIYFLDTFRSFITKNKSHKPKKSKELLDTKFGCAKFPYE